MRRLMAGLALMGVLAACGESTENLGAQDKGSEPKSDVVGETSSTTERETTTTEVERQDLRIVESGFSSYKPEYSDTVQGSFGLIIENPNPDHWTASSVDVNATFYDQAGTAVGTETDTLAVVLPGQKAAVGTEVYDFNPAAARMEVQLQVSTWEETEEATGSFKAEGTATTSDEFGGVKTTAQVVSTFEKDLSDVSVVAVYRDGAGKIVGGAFTFADFVPAGGKVGVELSTSGVQAAAATEVYATPSFLSL